LFTKPVRITSKKAAAWPSNEVDDINAARIAGKSDAEICELVKLLHAKRKELFPAFGVQQ
jgi:prophage regulatory protein